MVQTRYFTKAPPRGKRMRLIFRGHFDHYGIDSFLFFVHYDMNLQYILCMKKRGSLTILQKANRRRTTIQLN